MYNIVNYDLWWKYPKSFSDFMSAFLVYNKLSDINSSIEFYDFESNTRQIVWDNSFERSINE